jgi:hypothetical protein
VDQQTSETDNFKKKLINQNGKLLIVTKVNKSEKNLICWHFSFEMMVKEQRVYRILKFGTLKVKWILGLRMFFYEIQVFGRFTAVQIN